MSSPADDYRALADTLDDRSVTVTGTEFRHLYEHVDHLLDELEHHPELCVCDSGDTIRPPVTCDIHALAYLILGIAGRK